MRISNGLSISYWAAITLHKVYITRTAIVGCFRGHYGNATHQKSLYHVTGQTRGRESWTVFNRLDTAYDMTENRQQRKFKPIGCDFDGDIVRHDRNPV
ncbi:hypothetical protein AVEN_16228-1 [Araneus ventricosus]|uniref:Uncharacterized protein n=1 Tax=Araneus ventricosus TaxID=182803 RepID=A0A4Y2SYQ6_ARAVE|nr:hypothetical protein AVEN_16228-1 [Araneus ventricosus]